MGTPMISNDVVLFMDYLTRTYYVFVFKKLKSNFLWPCFIDDNIKGKDNTIKKDKDKTIS